ncbi:hypothetical protein QBC33DRAFT_551709 [Phialemonium atrogriseum]|uniref:Uncharacterized protein n=1 Tax=Phialemonium atrogriseum TaxID=1093897 RepID=A0AAJ0BUX2_9PEZI|nr:uncharacterized protein QBC33DRAFT_551709 [Phialemonium atrogriseum]KAK1762501.1 hypothetical protein QBC33DRAFT_551709 [Phialemonium atrogriseum]
MATANDMVADMMSIAGNIEATPAKFHNLRFRPSSEEAARLHELAAEILTPAQTLQETNAHRMRNRIGTRGLSEVK